MTEEEILINKFCNSLNRGTGEAQIIIRNNPKINFSDCVSDYLFDSNGDYYFKRDLYFFEIITLIDKKEEFLNNLIEEISKGTWIEFEHQSTYFPNPKTEVQLGILKQFAIRGYQNARRAIFNFFEENSKELICNWLGLSEIVEIDGIDGLIYAADTLGKNNKFKNNSQLGFISNCDLRFTEINIIEKLEIYAQSNESIKKFLDAYKIEFDALNFSHRELKTFDNIIDEALNTSIVRKLSTAEIIEIASRLIIEENKEKTLKLLKFFRYEKFPLDSDYILTFINQLKKYHGDFFETVIKVLSLISCDKVRNYAINKMNYSKRASKFILILVSNYQKGDSNILLKIIQNESINGYVDWEFAQDVIGIYQQNNSKECKEPLIALYNNVNSEMIRYEIVKILIDNDVLPDKIREEIQYDCNFETREFLSKVL